MEDLETTGISPPDRGLLKKLTINANGTIEESLHNYEDILLYDSQLQGLAFDEFACKIVKRQPFPWTKNEDSTFFSDADSANLHVFLSRKYRLKSSAKCDEAVIAVAHRRGFHPVREYINSLTWDGVPRVDILLIDYLGAVDSEYVRRVTRITLVGAVARVFHPGVKFDTMLVLVGAQGIGKSTLPRKLAGPAGAWFTDSVTINDFGSGKDALEKMAGHWIVEIPELVGLSKSDERLVKGFLAASEDTVRWAYGHYVENIPRQSIFIGSTNEIEGFLRDHTGGRRFYPVEVSGGTAEKNPNTLTDEIVGQIWAEAKVMFDNNEKIYIPSDDPIIKTARSVQQHFIVSDERQGLIEQFLEMEVPKNWYELGSIERWRIFSGFEQAKSDNYIRRETVCNLEIACECFNLKENQLDVKLRNEINLIMAKIPGWRRSNKPGKVFPPYGKQRYYERVHEEQG